MHKVYKKHACAIGKSLFFLRPFYVLSTSFLRLFYVMGIWRYGNCILCISGREYILAKGEKKHSAQIVSGIILLPTSPVLRRVC